MSATADGGTRGQQALLDGAPLATLVGEPVSTTASPSPGDRLVISRFAWLRRHDGALLAETALGRCTVVLQDPRAAGLLVVFAAPVTLEEALGAHPWLPLPGALAVISLLAAAGVLITVSNAAAEQSGPLAVWEFHDLLFHARSRDGRRPGPSGGTYRFGGRVLSAPPIPPTRWPESIELPEPDWDRLEHEDPSLARVQSSRMSVARHGEPALSLIELGEFLYRVGRIEDVWEEPGPGHVNDRSVVAKPYPGAGARYELELYPAVRTCRGLEPGLYHYAADRHALERVAGWTSGIDEMVSNAARAMGVPGEPLQVVITIAARIGRIATKYEAIAYSLVLKDVGVLYQTMYLAAAAMGLAPCAIGKGDSDLFAAASGLHYYEESAVGEFVLGSRPDVSA